MTISSNYTTMMPPVNNISKDIVSQNDTDSDSALSLEELGIDEDSFNQLDSDGDGLVTQTEIASAIDSQLSSYDQMPSKEEFASLLSDLGLQMPQPPQQTDNSNSSSASDFASQILSAYDTDGDSLLSSTEASVLNDEEFSALDTDGDGSISETELSDAYEQVASSGSTPPPPGGAPMSGGSSEEDDEYYSSLDTNKDGVISKAERDAANEALGISSDDTSTTTSSSTSSSSTANDETLNSLKLLMDTIKLNAQNQDEQLDLSSFKNIMKMVNNQNNNSDLNTYVSNLSKSNSSSMFNYA